MKKTKFTLKKILLSFFLFIVIAFTSLIIWKWDSFYKIKDIEIREINCSHKAELLEDVYKNDQRIRKQNVPFKEFVEVDHSNLETVISILEHCGMPTLEELSPKQMGAIWLALQHSPDKKHTKKYFPLIEKAVENGDLTKSQYATMKDRLLMEEGKPQIYGTQIKRGKLYKLESPETVNQRREEMGMKSIERYLRDFNIDYKPE